MKYTFEMSRSHMHAINVHIVNIKKGQLFVRCVAYNSYEKNVYV